MKDEQNTVEQVNQKIANYYHASHVPGLSVLNPMPSNVIDGEKAVFAKKNRNDVLHHGQPNHGKIDSGRVVSRYEKDGPYEEERYLKELVPNAFNDVYAGKESNIYSFKGHGFKKDPRLSSGERIRRTPVTVEGVEHIKDLLQAIKDSKNYKLYNYGEVPKWEKKAGITHCISNQTLHTTHHD